MPGIAEVVRNRNAEQVASDEQAVWIDGVEGDLRAQLVNVAPLADEFRQTEVLLTNLERQLANTVVQRTEIEAATASVSADWYRSITPVEPTSNIPVAIAMAFAAAVPAFIAAVILVALNLNRRLVVRDREHGLLASGRAAAA